MFRQHSSRFIFCTFAVANTAKVFFILANAPQGSVSFLTNKYLSPFTPSHILPWHNPP